MPVSSSPRSRPSGFPTPGHPAVRDDRPCWATVFPVGEYALRTNLLGALFASARRDAVPGNTRGGSASKPGSGGNPGRPIERWNAAHRRGGSHRGVHLPSWQNSNETEVYAASTFTIAAVMLAMLRWRARRGTSGPRRYLFLVGYLVGLRSEIICWRLLAGPAVVAFIVATYEAGRRWTPDRRREWADAAVVAGAWALLLGVGLASPTLAHIGVTAAWARWIRWHAGRLGSPAPRRGRVRGRHPYLYLYIRAVSIPRSERGAAHNWNALVGHPPGAVSGAHAAGRSYRAAQDPDNPGRRVEDLRPAAGQLHPVLRLAVGQRSNRATLAGAAAPHPVTLLLRGLGVRGMLAAVAERRAAGGCSSCSGW